MEAKFTKGEWKAINNGLHWNNKNLINWEIQHGYDGECIVDHVYNEADAKLIAAAPEMYELLKRLLDTCGFVNEIAETDALNLLTKINS